MECWPILASLPRPWASVCLVLLPLPGCWALDSQPLSQVIALAALCPSHQWPEAGDQ